MKEVVFELEYTCTNTGERVSREVSSFGTARKLAKELARATGRRAIIKRRSKPKSWMIYTADMQTGRVKVAMQSLTKDFAIMLVRQWNELQTDCVLIAWPEWMPDFTIEINRSAA